MTTDIALFTVTENEHIGLEEWVKFLIYVFNTFLYLLRSIISITFKVLDL